MFSHVVLPVAVSLAASTATLPRSGLRLGVCTFSVMATPADSCASLATTWSLSLDRFTAYNPAVGARCAEGLVVGRSYCVEQDYGEELMREQRGQRGRRGRRENEATTTIMGSAEPTLTTTILASPTHPQSFAPTTLTVSATATATTTTTTVTAIVSPTSPSSPPRPIQPGLADKCIRYHLVQPGDTCERIVYANSGAFSLSDFYSWNPSVGGDCRTLWLGYYVCIGVAA